MQKLKIIFAHGNGGGTAKDNWFPWLKTELERLGLKVIAQTFPDNDLARASIWLPFLKKLSADKNTIIIGHSSGAVAAMRYAQKNKLLGSILIGASYTDLGDAKEKASGYYDKPWDWEEIKNNQKFIVQFHSTDDPYIPVSEAHFIRDHLNSEYYEFTNRGHFMIDHNPVNKKFPEILKVVENELNIYDGSVKHTKSAGGVILNPKGEVLVVSQHGTTWSLPKGHLEEGEDEVAAARREIYEETGIKQLDLVEKLGTFQRYQLDEKGNEVRSEWKTIVIYLFKTKTIALKPIDPENPEARWVSKDKIADLLTRPEDKDFFRGVIDKI